MPLHEVLKEIDKTLYPDIAQAGSLDVAISKSLSDVGSKLISDGTEVNKFMPYARVENGSRFSQIHIAGGQRLFLFDFWSDGVVFGSASCSEISDVARSIHAWITDGLSTEKMSALFTFFTPSESGKAHEAGVYVEHQWQSLLEGWRVQEKSFGSPERTPTRLIEAAMKRPELRQLFPFTSLISLCFSRTTGYPFTRDCPRIEPQGNDIYWVYMPTSFEIFGKGNIEEVLDILIEHLPPNCGAAINGTADDFAF